jgi:phosphoribosylformylglycinamidine synthase
MVAVGADPDHIGGVDNFCWPNIAYHHEHNPDGKFKAAQLVRSCKAMAEMCLSYGIPLLSGKDSMYVDGHLLGPFGETRKISALESLQFSAVGVIENVEKCVSLDVKFPGDRLYLLGLTRNELGGSEYYERFGNIGIKVPEVDPGMFFPLYHALHESINQSLSASVHGVYRGGLAVHLAMKAMAGNLGLSIDLDKVPVDREMRNDKKLFSESAGRFLVSVAPKNCRRFESLLEGLPYACIGEVIEEPTLKVTSAKYGAIISIPVSDLKIAWKKPFGGLI